MRFAKKGVEPFGPLMTAPSWVAMNDCSGVTAPPRFPWAIESQLKPAMEQLLTDA